MIHELRVAHFRAFVVLAVALPAGIVAGLAARTPPPRVDALPPDLARAAGWDGVLPAEPEWTRRDLLARPPAEAALYRDADDRRVLVLRPLREPEAPDLLVYWAAGNAPDGALADGAVWLGVLAGTGARAFVLPAAAAGDAGRIQLYSLAHASLVDDAALPGAP